jgi:hypothetical protein
MCSNNKLKLKIVKRINRHGNSEIPDPLSFTAAKAMPILYGDLENNLEIR